MVLGYSILCFKGVGWILEFFYTISEPNLVSPLAQLLSLFIFYHSRLVYSATNIVVACKSNHYPNEPTLSPFMPDAMPLSLLFLYFKQNNNKKRQKDQLNSPINSGTG